MDLNINTDDFIIEIENEPSIWNTALEDYGNRLTKANAWERVILKFVEDFNEQTPAEKNRIVAGFQRKWKSLRDSFSRELLKKKKDSSSVMRKQYMYFNQLSFLQNVTKQRASSIEEDDDDSQTFEAAVEISKSTTQRRSQLKSNKRTMKRQEELITVPKKIVANSTTEPGQSDADTLFMMSLVPELKQLPANIKLDVKCELMKVLQRAKLMCNSDSSQFFNQSHFLENIGSTSQGTNLIKFEASPAESLCSAAWSDLSN